MADQLQVEVRGLNETIANLKGIGRAIPVELRTAVKRSAFRVESRVKRNLSGPSHSRFPGNSNPYPGVGPEGGGTLRRSVTTLIGDRGLSATVGPGGLASSYAEIQERGGVITQTLDHNRTFMIRGSWVTIAAGRTLTIRIPARPYMRPSLEQTREAIIGEFEDAIRRSIR